MNKKKYRKLAKKYGTSIEEVKQDMQEAIPAAYTDPHRNLINIKMQNAVPRKGEIPTPDELIRFLTAEVRKQSSET